MEVDELRLPAVALGTNNLIKKVERQLFAWYLETFPEDLPHLLQATCSGTFDLGVESQIPQVLASDVSKLLPQFIAGSASELEDDRPHAAFAEIQEEPLQQPSYPWKNCVTIAGMLHALDGAEQHLHAHCPVWPGFKLRMQQVIKLFQSSHNRRFVFSCIHGSAHAHLESQLNIRISKFSEHRWSSVVKALKKLMSVETVLTTVWSKGRFQASFSQSGPFSQRLMEDVQGEDEHKIDISSIDASIGSAFFWATADMLLELQEIIEEFRAWLESCPCHRSVLQGLSTTQQHTFLRRELGRSRSQQSEADLFLAQGCPMAGRNAPYLAAGEHKAFLRKLSDVAAEKLKKRRLPALTPSEASRLMDSFAKSSSAVLLYLSVKTAAWDAQPLSLAALAHPNVEVAKQSARKCMAEFDRLSPEAAACQHDLTIRCFHFEGAVRPLLQAWVASDVEDEASVASGPLAELLGEFSMWIVVERWLEQPHSVLKRLGSYKGVGGAFCSLSVRFSVVMQEVVKDPDHLRQLCEAFAKVRTPMRMAAQLNLLSHPQVAAVLVTRCGRQRRQSSQLWRAVSNAIYMLDAQSQYTRNRTAEAEHEHLSVRVQRAAQAGRAANEPEVADTYVALRMSLLRAHMAHVGMEWFSLPSALIVESGLFSSVEDHMVAPAVEALSFVQRGRVCHTIENPAMLIRCLKKVCKFQNLAVANMCTKSPYV